MVEDSVEYIIIEFPGNHFHGHRGLAIAKLIESSKRSRIIDLVSITKAPNGTCQHLRVRRSSICLAPVASLQGEVGVRVN